MAARPSTAPDDGQRDDYNPIQPPLIQPSPTRVTVMPVKFSVIIQAEITDRSADRLSGPELSVELAP